jgi:hypothetical protein
MSNARITAERLQQHHLIRPGPADPVDVVGWFGAVQAQDFGAATWALALRMRGAITGTDIERAFDAGRILRTRPMRPAWHFVAVPDIRLPVDLTAARVRRALAFGRTSFAGAAAGHRLRRTGHRQVEGPARGSGADDSTRARTKTERRRAAPAGSRRRVVGWIRRRAVQALTSDRFIGFVFLASFVLCL